MMQEVVHLQAAPAVVPTVCGPLEVHVTFHKTLVSTLSYTSCLSYGSFVTALHVPWGPSFANCPLLSLLGCASWRNPGLKSTLNAR